MDNFARGNNCPKCENSLKIDDKPHGNKEERIMVKETPVISGYYQKNLICEKCGSTVERWLREFK